MVGDEKVEALKREKGSVVGETSRRRGGEAIPNKRYVLIKKEAGLECIF